MNSAGIPERRDDRMFRPSEHIRNLRRGALEAMFDDNGDRLVGISGVSGSRGSTWAGTALGIDRIVLLPGSSFPLHTHEGDHLLVVLAGVGSIHVDGVDYELVEGDSIYVPADYPHGVGGPRDDRAFELLAFGIPHHPIDSTTRMRLVHEPSTPSLDGLAR